jgi:hypothetical protein
MAKLARAVIVRDPERHRDLIFKPGDEPSAEHAVLIRNAACWEGGKLPAAVKRALAAKENPEDDQDPTGGASGGGSDSGDGDHDTATKQAAPAAKKTAAKKAASTPARGRAAAGEGDSGE